MAADNFPPCLGVILVYEGGKVDNKADPGGRTNEGITQTTYNADRARRGLARRDVYLMTDDERDAIYRSGFWDKIGADTLPPGVDLVTFDPAVNSGPARGLAWLRKAQSANPGASADAIITAICGYRLSFMHALGTWRAFGKGWGARVASVEAKGHRMALGHSPAATATIKAKAVAHSDKAKTARTQRNIAVSGSTAASGTTAAAGGHTGLVIALLLAGIAAAGILAFVAWRSSQRAAALGAEAAKPTLPPVSALPKI